MKHLSSNKIILILLIILLIFNYIILAIDGINSATDPQGWDTTAYLGEAVFIKHHGGVLNFLNLCFTGKWEQANQHPLYILLLTPFASTDTSFFVTAKIVNAVIGLILLLVLFYIGQKLFGYMVASIAVFALILNEEFIMWTTLVACESLLMLVSTLCIYYIIKGFKNNKYWVYAGIFAGLAYLTKGTGLLLLPGFALSSIIMYKFRIFKNKFFWLFFFLFLVTSSPLLIRNIVVYNNPIFNVNNYLITMGWEKIDQARYLTFDLNEGASNWKFDESFYQNEQKSENKNESLFNINSFSKKLIKGAGLFLSAINISWSYKLPSSLLMNLFALFLLFLFVVGLIKEENKGAKIYLLSTIAIFFLILTYNPIVRYYFPLIPIMWVYIALGILVISEFLYERFTSKIFKFNFILFFPLLLIILLLINSASMVTKRDISNPLNSVKYSESRLELLNWLRENLKQDDTYTMGPNFNWQLEKGTWVLPPFNSRQDFSKFQSFVKRQEISYIIINKDTFKDMFEENNSKEKNSFFNYFGFDPIRGIIEKKQVDDWSLVYSDRKGHVDLLIYKSNFN